MPFGVKVLFKKPKEVYRKAMLDDSDAEPRDLKQVKNRRYAVQQAKRRPQAVYNNNVADHVLRVLAMANDHPLVQRVLFQKGVPPAVILYTDDNISDMKSTLTNEPMTVFGVDRTFNLGTVFVTTIVFKHPALLRTETREHPIFVGPMFIHGRSTVEDYVSFFSHIAVKVGADRPIIFGTDSEKALTSALHQCFPKSTHLLCTLHLKSNLEDHMKDKTG